MHGNLLKKNRSILKVEKDIAIKRPNIFEFSSKRWLIIRDYTSYSMHEKQNVSSVFLLYIFQFENNPLLPNPFYRKGEN